MPEWFQVQDERHSSEHCSGALHWTP